MSILTFKVPVLLMFRPVAAQPVRRRVVALVVSVAGHNWDGSVVHGCPSES